MTAPERAPDDVDTEPIPAEPVRTGQTVSLRKTCKCGKDGTQYSHGPFTCAQLSELRARIEFQRLPRLRRWQLRLRDRFARCGGDR